MIVVDVQLNGLDELSREECLELLRRQVVGRLIVMDKQTPLVFPVNYAMAGDHVVFRTDTGTKLALLDRWFAAFEVDDFDPDEHSGWSVYLHGTAHEVDIGTEAEVLRRIDGPAPTPWAPGHRDHLVELVPTTMTGRRIAASSAS